MSPYLVLSTIIAVAYGAAFHLWKGRGVRELLLYLIASWLGFALGQMLGESIGSELLLIGPVHILEGTVVSWAAILAAWWLKV